MFFDVYEAFVGIDDLFQVQSLVTDEGEGGIFVKVLVEG